MKGWTHFSVWRLWFTFKAVANSWAPSPEIWLQLRLQNVREQEMRGGSTNFFILCMVYLVSVSQIYWDTVSDTVCQDVQWGGENVIDVKQLYITAFLWWLSLPKCPQFSLVYVHANISSNSYQSIIVCHAIQLHYFTKTILPHLQIERKF